MKQNLYKLILIFLLSLFINHVNAYSSVTIYDFSEIMEEEGYTVDKTASGGIAYKEDYNTTYMYETFESEEKAYEKFAQYVNQTSDNEVLINKLNSYNEDNSSGENYNILSYTYEEIGTTTNNYYYMFRVNNALVYGYGNVKFQDEIKNVVEKLVDDQILLKVKPTHENEQPSKESNPQEETKKDNKLYILIISIIILVFIIIIIFIFRKRKNNTKAINKH